ncbi:MAG: aldo/keto reductase [Candidatus Acetothermia bacterium]|nr:aldo/keto reductase [Candidatus Acetothermia bacterium]
MEFRWLGGSELWVSAIGLGTLAFGGAYGPVDEGEAVAVVHRALDCGINFFDTSDNYGHGRAEELLGRALRGRRKEAIVATKGGTAVDARGRPSNDARPETILRAAEGSLRRLRTDWIDLYQLHLPDPATPFADTARALERLVKAGKVRYVGVSNFWEEDLLGWLEVGPAVANQMPYNFLHRDIEDGLLPLCRKRGIGLIAYQPLLFGLFSGRIGPDTTFALHDHRRAYPHFVELIRAAADLRESLGALAREWGLVPAQLALRWAISRPGVTCAIPGAKRPKQVEENARAGERPFTPDELGEIDRILTGSQVSVLRTIDLPVEEVRDGPRGRYAVLAMGIRVRVPDGVEAGDMVTMDIVTGQLEAVHGGRGPRGAA